MKDINIGSYSDVVDNFNIKTLLRSIPFMVSMNLLSESVEELILDSIKERMNTFVSIIDVDFESGPLCVLYSTYLEIENIK